MMARKHMQARENEGQGQKLETKGSHGLPGPTYLPCAHPSGPDDIPTKQISMAEEETGTQTSRERPKSTQWENSWRASGGSHYVHIASHG